MVEGSVVQLLSQHLLPVSPEETAMQVDNGGQLAEEGLLGVRVKPGDGGTVWENRERGEC